MAGSGDKRVYVQAIGGDGSRGDVRLAVEVAREVAKSRGITFASAYNQLAALPLNNTARWLWESRWRRVMHPASELARKAAAARKGLQ